MQLTRFTDYGLRILLHLGKVGLGEKESLSNLSARYNMNHHHVNKVSQKMASLGWIHSTRGKSGGISINPSVLDLSIEQIVRELESNLYPIDCAGLECPLAGKCTLQGILGEALNAFLAVLGRYKLGDITDDDLRVLRVFSDNG